MAGIEAAIKEAARQAAIYRPQGLGPEAQAILDIPPQMTASGLTGPINLLLYLCSTNAEMVERASGRLRPRRPTLTKTQNGMRMFPAEKPALWEVAYRLGAAIRHAQEAPRTKPGDRTHASPRPHVRRAHWHAFWTGPKAKPDQPQPTDRKLLLHWLPPIPVNVEEEAPIIPTVDRVIR